MVGTHAVDATEEHEFSLRLLRHLATSVQHHKYEDIDVVTVRVDRRLPESLPHRSMRSVRTSASQSAG